MPDDGVIIVRREALIVRNAREEAGVIYAAEPGFPGSFNEDAMAHTRERDNPHEDSLENIVTPDGYGGKWLKLGADAVVITDEQPIFLEDIHAPVSNDELLKTDENGTPQRLEGVVSRQLCVNGHRLRLRGDDGVGRRMFFGTDAAGTLGFNPVPGEQVIP